MTYLRLIIKLASLSVLVIFVLYLAAVYQNNRDEAMPEQAQLELQLEASIQWMVNNESSILSQANPMLWWMLYETHTLSQDKRLASLLEKYHQARPQLKHSLWGPLFDAPKHGYLDAYSVQSLPYYNQHFIYALNCAARIERESPLVKQQNDADFCHQSAYFYRPACITHQLMGINFLSTKQCQLLANIDEVRQALQQDIVTQLTWDIRVVDVYLQRVLMLLITGAELEVKPIWVQQVLRHQLKDGGWSDFSAWFGVDGERSIGFSAKVISLGEEKSTFHATAQGMYILSYLLSNEKD